MEAELFEKIRKAVWKGLHMESKSIAQLEEERGRKYLGDVGQKKFECKSVWQSKKDIDKFVENELNIDIDKYGLKKSENHVYKKIAGEISVLRDAGKITDWRYGKPRYGIWRLTNSVEQQIFVNFKGGDYSSPPQCTRAVKRTRQTQFRNKLLGSFHHCLFCEFKLDMYLRAAHIVPFKQMQKHDPKNTMNPVNGLLLCTLCDIAFERGVITVDEDYHISTIKELKRLNKLSTTHKCWISNVKETLQIRKASKIKPDAGYLKWKIRLNNR